MVQDFAYPHLFSSLQLGAMRLRNRIVHASTTTRYVKNGAVSERLIAYHVNRARGGASMTVTEPLAVLPRQRTGAKVDVCAPGNFEALHRWSDAVRAEGSLLIGQLQDPGRGRHEEGRPPQSIGASALPDDLSWTVPHALSTREAEQAIADFVVSARTLKNAGWGGVEISAGHGHLFHQFLSAASNHRTDKFGGDLQGRARFLLELIEGLRAECGSEFLIGVKLPGEDGVAGGIDLAQSEAITRLVHASGHADYLTYCWGSHADTLDWHLPDTHGPRTPYIDKINRLAAAAPGMTIGALGLITDPNEAERILREGPAALIMLARPLLTDPAWGRKAAEGREAEIRYCVSCNTCWHIITAQAAIQCDNNPRLGTADEADWTPTSAAAHKRVVVVGAGPAGMEAAWVAAARGHRVTVLGASSEVGGKTRLHATLPGGEGLSSVYDYQALAAQRAGVEFVLGAAASLGDILALEPDVVVLATGSTPAWPNFLPEDYNGAGVFLDIRQSVANLAKVTARQPGRAVVYDRDHTAFTYAAVEFLAARFEAVTVITPRERLASAEALVNRQGIYRRLSHRGIEILTLTEPLAGSAFEDEQIDCANVYSGAKSRINGVSLFTYATPRLPNDALAAPLAAAGLDVRVIGDCYAPRLLLNATSDGHRVGAEI